MQHQFEFVAELNNGGHVHQVYKGKSSRLRKVQIAIMKDLKKVYNIEPNEIKDMYLKPYKSN